MKTQMYAAYDDLSIYAIGTTRHEALDEAQDAVNDPHADFKVARIGYDLAREICTNGWNGKHQSFSVIDGEIVDTTNA